MSCELEREKLSAYIDGELTQEELQRLEEHLKICAVCQKELEDIKSVSHFISSQEKYCAPDEVLRSVEEHIKSTPPAESARTGGERRAGTQKVPYVLQYKKFFEVVLAAAACLLVVFTLIYIQPGTRERVERETTILGTADKSADFKKGPEYAPEKSKDELESKADIREKVAKKGEEEGYARTPAMPQDPQQELKQTQQVPEPQKSGELAKNDQETTAKEDEEKKLAKGGAKPQEALENTQKGDENELVKEGEKSQEPPGKTEQVLTPATEPDLSKAKEEKKEVVYVIYADDIKSARDKLTKLIAKLDFEYYDVDHLAKGYEVTTNISEDSVKKLQKQLKDSKLEMKTVEDEALVKSLKEKSRTRAFTKGGRDVEDKAEEEELQDKDRKEEQRVYRKEKAAQESQKKDELQLEAEKFQVIKIYVTTKEKQTTAPK